MALPANSLPSGTTTSTTKPVTTQPTPTPTKSTPTPTSSGNPITNFFGWVNNNVVQPVVKTVNNAVVQPIVNAVTSTTSTTSTSNVQSIPYTGKGPRPLPPTPTKTSTTQPSSGNPITNFFGWVNNHVVQPVVSTVNNHVVQPVVSTVNKVVVQPAVNAFNAFTSNFGQDWNKNVVPTWNSAVNDFKNGNYNPFHYVAKLGDLGTQVINTTANSMIKGVDSGVNTFNKAVPWASPVTNMFKNWTHFTVRASQAIATVATGTVSLVGNVNALASGDKQTWNSFTNGAKNIWNTLTDPTKRQQVWSSAVNGVKDSWNKDPWGTAGTVAGTIATFFLPGPGEAKVATTASDGARVLADGSQILADGTRLAADGSKIASATDIAAHTTVPLTTDTAKGLQTTIDRAVTAFQKGYYATAHSILTDTKLAAQHGIELDVSALVLNPAHDPASYTLQDLQSLGTQAALNSMSWTNGKVSITDAFRFGADGTGQSLAQMPNVAQHLMPTMIEEWTHQLQNAAGGPISKLMQQYMSATGAAYDHEAEIQALFREWGFPVDQISSAARHSDVRGPFEQWYKSVFGGGP